MTRPIRLAINGASGRMGSAIQGLLEDDTRFELAFAVTAAGTALDRRPTLVRQTDGARYSSDWTAAPPLDVVIDFSSPSAVGAALDHCIANGVALVTGTTGIDAALELRLVDAAKNIAILRAANFSIGVAVLTRLVREAAAALPEWDVEIVEAHHARKLDAPSGTALALGRAAAAARRTTLDAAAVRSGEGRNGERVSGDIGFAVVRGGDIVGEHLAMLMGQGERLELGHRATDRSIFARGALQAAHWLVGRAAGQWQLEDVIATT
ncbi:MAG: 4-hydroxy-tetrahydrodipicolinate reductase [Rhodanobacter sp.]